MQDFIDENLVGSPSEKKRTSEGICNVGSTSISWYISRYQFH